MWGPHPSSHETELVHVVLYHQGYATDEIRSRKDTAIPEAQEQSLRCIERQVVSI